MKRDEAIETLSAESKVGRFIVWPMDGRNCQVLGVEVMPSGSAICPQSTLPAIGPVRYQSPQNATTALCRVFPGFYGEIVDTQETDTLADLNRAGQTVSPQLVLCPHSWSCSHSWSLLFSIALSLNVMSDPSSLRIAIGGDHAGFPLKQLIAEKLHGTVSSIIDCGTDNEESCDYPDFAIAVSKALVEGRADRGLMICGSGIGVSVAANKIPGIRAAICHDTYSAHQGVEHDDMNVLCVGGRIIGSELAMEIVHAFLSARYTPADRHARRLNKILEIERLGLDALNCEIDGETAKR